MLMILLRRVPSSLKGELSRWLLEPMPGVFLGRVSAIVRDALWEKCCERVGAGGCLMVFPWPNEQGFQIRSYGKMPRQIVDLEGLYLTRKPSAEDPAKDPPSPTADLGEEEAQDLAS